ncbi:MAG TPA: nucleotidyl transferase AbiEii/AbiGii toxin family protein [Candidatus Eisenbacteria bacterium]
MPLTAFQLRIARILAVNRSPDSHLAGGAALHFAPNSKRYSNDLDYFHDSVERVATAFGSDRDELKKHGITVELEMNQPGYLRAVVSSGNDQTKIEWAHDSSWRFMPAIYNSDVGFQLHPIDIAVNKVMALAGRDEARDFVDILYIDKEILPLGPLCWAAAGKDPGLSPGSLLELLKRRGRYRPEDFSALMMTEPMNLAEMKSEWLEILNSADNFIRGAPADQIGCLYYSKRLQTFVDPQAHGDTTDIELHFGRPGGILPKFYPGDPFPRTKDS